jgi:low temperature requirement protein LtrA
MLGMPAGVRPSPEAPALIRPVRLQTGRAGSASRLELFFDLAYVVVVLELASGFLHDLTWSGLTVFVGLFVAIWVSWVGFTLYANRFDTDDLVFRLMKLLATLAVAGCAASATGATKELAIPFAASFLATRVLLLLLYLRAWRHVGNARPTIAVYLGCLAVTVVLWAVSLAVAAELRPLLWLIAVLVDALGPVLATLRDDKLPLHIEHLPERFALLVILVLGEAVGAIARGVHDAGWAVPSLLTGLISFVVTAGLWWIYFDVAAAASARQLEETEDGKSPDTSDGMVADQRHDMFVYGHLPMTLGVVLTSIGLEEIVLHPLGRTAAASTWLLGGGVALFAVGTALIVGGTVRTWRSVWPWPLVGVPLVLIAALLPYPHGWLLVAVVALVVTMLAVAGTLVSRRPENVPHLG